jgi:amino acid adenylation domain-containing protein
MQNEVVEGFTLSPQQRHLWSLLEDGPGTDYRAQCAILIGGSLQRARLEAALRLVVQRHEILRTTFHNLPGMRFPVQVVSGSAAPVCNEYDLSGLSLLEREAQNRRLSGELRRRPFDLRNGPPMHLSLLKLAPDEHLLLVSLPALCADAATLRNLAREIGRCYDGSAAEEPMQYADLSEWQNEISGGEHAAGGAEFWRKQAEGAPLTLKLPFETRPRVAAEFNPRFLTSVVSPRVSPKLAQLVRRYETSAPIFLLACWQALLWHLTRSPDIVVVAAHDGRAYEELEGALGLFVKYLPVRARVGENSRFDEFLKEVGELSGEARRWQQVFAWERVTGATQGAEPRFAPVAFAYERQAPKQFAAGISLFIAEQYVCVDRFKLKLSCVESDEALTTEFHYDPGLVSPQQAETICRRFHMLLESAIERPAALIRDLDILGDNERERLLFRLNDTAAELPEVSSVQEMFEAQARRRPADEALICEGRRLSYQELNARANRLAHHLRALGVRPEVRVGLCVERSAEMVVGLLGVLKAGGAYVPLESDHPEARLLRQLAEARASVLLTQESIAPRLARFGGTVLYLDRDGCLWDSRPEENPPPLNTPEHLAYVLYTSGSTGTPKAVGVTHRNLINYADDTCRRLGAHESRLNFAMVSTLSADLCVTSLFGALLSGGCLHLLSYLAATSGPGMAAYMAEHGIDVLKIVPSHLNALINAGGNAEVIPRRHLLLGGEALSRELMRRLNGLKSECRVVNEYGPTETTVGSVVYTAGDEGEWGAASTVPVGRPLANTQVYILDQWMRPVAPGVEGELYVGGAGLARGYLNGAGRTAERFVPHPFSREGGMRLYRTGDVARHLEDGNIEFIGRADDQVKVSGYRVELGEIEAALTEHEMVSEALVLAEESEPGQKRLIAYVVAARGNQAPASAGGDGYEFQDTAAAVPVTGGPGTVYGRRVKATAEPFRPPSAQELREYLKERLPPYMLPAIFVPLDALPLTPNGKVDRRALPRPEQAGLDAAEHVAPRDEMEGIMASIWRKVSGLEMIGIHDDYFAAGGDSIRVIQVVHELAQYGISVTAMDVFRYRTINRLASHVRESKVEGEKTPPPLELLKLSEHLAALLPTGIEDAYPPAQMQEFVIEHYANDQQRMGVYHIQQSYHIYDRELSVEALQGALEILVHSHPALRTTFVFGLAAGPVQVVHRHLPVSVRQEDLRGLSPAEQEEYIDGVLTRDRTSLFDVSRTGQPLFRFAVFLRSEQEAEFFMSVHHAIIDGWGNQQLMNDLVEAYAALKRGEAKSPTGGPNTYKEFVALEHEIVSSKAAADFWRGHLSGHRWRPLKKRDSAHDERAETNHIAALRPELAARLKGAAKGQRVSLKSLFLSAYLDLIASVTGGGQNTVGVVANGRSERLSNPLKALGLFWNIIPFCRAGGSDDRPSQVRAVQQSLIETELYARYPLRQLLRERGEAELFSATFNFLHFHNMKGDKFDSGFRLLGQRLHDKFHFPLNYIISVDPFNENIAVRVEYDKRYFDGETIEAMSNDYLALLSEHV